MTDLRELSTAELCKRLHQMKNAVQVKGLGYPMPDAIDLIHEAARRLRALTEWNPWDESPEDGQEVLILLSGGDLICHCIWRASDMLYEDKDCPSLTWRQQDASGWRELPPWEGK